MASFGVELEPSKEAKAFVIETHDRLQEENILRNPFHGKALLKGNTAFVHIKPVYLNFPLIACAFVFFPTLFWKGLVFSKLYVLAGVFFLISLIWSKYFFYVIFKKGIRNKGYKGRIKLLSSEETIRRLI